MSTENERRKISGMVAAALTALIAACSLGALAVVGTPEAWTVLGIPIFLIAAITVIRLMVGRRHA